MSVWSICCFVSPLAKIVAYRHSWNLLFYLSRLICSRAKTMISVDYPYRLIHWLCILRNWVKLPGTQPITPTSWYSTLYLSNKSKSLIIVHYVQDNSPLPSFVRCCNRIVRRKLTVRWWWRWGLLFGIFGIWWERFFAVVLVIISLILMGFCCLSIRLIFGFDRCLKLRNFFQKAQLD